MMTQIAHRAAVVAVGCSVLFAVASCRSSGDRSRADEPILSIPPSMNPVVEIDTTLGSFRLTLDAHAAPVTVMNFIDYADASFYNGTTFHRVISAKMIQGGAFTPTMRRMTAGLRDPIINEWESGLKNKQWTIGMVRRPGVVDSAQSEFYINLFDHAALDMPTDGSAYCAFGAVTSGLETLERIRNVPVGTHPEYAAGRSAVVPQTPVVIRSVRVIETLDREAAIARVKELEDLRTNGIARAIEKYEAMGEGKAVRSETGLIYIDLVVGKGGLPAETSRLEVYYRGFLVNGLEFESQMETPALVQMPNLTRGMREGLLTMAEGGRRAIIMPPELAYGAGGIPGKIPPNATLIFEMELLEIK